MGIGSGGSNRLSDDEKKAKGTFKGTRSDSVYDAAAQAKVVAGPWLAFIPQPKLPLGEIGQSKYDELTKALFEQNKLTTVSANFAEQAALLYQEQYTRLSKGERVPAYLSDKLQRALSALKIAEDAPQITNPNGRINKFADVGFSNRTRQAR